MAGGTGSLSKVTLVVTCPHDLGSPEQKEISGSVDLVPDTAPVPADSRAVPKGILASPFPTSPFP